MIYVLFLLRDTRFNVDLDPVGIYQFNWAMLISATMAYKPRGIANETQHGVVRIYVDIS